DPARGEPRRGDEGEDREARQHRGQAVGSPAHAEDGGRKMLRRRERRDPPDRQRRRGERERPRKRDDAAPPQREAPADRGEDHVGGEAEQLRERELIRELRREGEDEVRGEEAEGRVVDRRGAGDGREGHGTGVARPARAEASNRRFRGAPYRGPGHREADSGNPTIRPRAESDNPDPQKVYVRSLPDVAPADRSVIA